MKIFPILTAALTAFVLSAIPASAEWPLDKMNAQIDITNVIVGGVCSGTIVNAEKRVVLTAFHCVTKLYEDVQEKSVDPKTGEVTTKTVRKTKPLKIIINKVVDYEIVSTVSMAAKIVGSDAANDIALVQIDDVDYKPAMQASLAPKSSKLMRGQTVYAVGNPNVVWDNSITKGIISSPQRTEVLDGKSYRFFQHSASIIGGNSGGSILNDNGALIGTVSAGVRGADIGFAVPISYTKALLKKSGFGYTTFTVSGSTHCKETVAAGADEIDVGCDKLKADTK